MLYTICYDVSDDRRRNRIAKILLGHGERVQYSVFEARIGAEQLERLKDRVKKEMDEETDSLRIYSLCETCRQKITIIGIGETTDYPDVVII